MMGTINLILLWTFFLVNYLNVGETKRLEHFGNYKEMTNSKFQHGCPQLSPNYQNEHCMTYQEFLKKSFFACGHPHNKAESIPSDYNIKGTYSHWRLTCDPNKKDYLGRAMRDKRNRANYNGLREAGRSCDKKAKTRCLSESELSQLRMSSTSPTP